MSQFTTNTSCAILYLYVNSENTELVQQYNEYVNKHNHSVQNDPFPNAGFDLFFPKETTFESTYKCLCQFVNFEIKGEMQIYDESKKAWKPSAYYIYPRSSISKTPLTLANNAGIIDSGYRGHLIGAFRSLNDYTVTQYSRLTQICSNDLRPIVVVLVDEGFLNTTNRGEGGFGSTGV